MADIAEALKINKGLNTLILESNCIGEDAIDILIKSLKENNIITHLDVSGHPNIENNKIENLQITINHNKELIKKLALFLKKSFLEEDNSANFVKILNTAKFYKHADKELLKKYLKEEKVDDPESIFIKMNNFIKTHSFTIAGICKELMPNEVVLNSEKHISHLSAEIIINIASYLDNTPWGWEVKAMGNTTPAE